MNECIDFFGEAGLFSILEAYSGYWQVEVEENKSDKAALLSHLGLCRFIRMSFTLKNDAGTFQRTMDGIMSLVKWQFVLVYLDSLVVLPRSPRVQISYMMGVLSLLQNAG